MKKKCEGRLVWVLMWPTRRSEGEIPLGDHEELSIFGSKRLALLRKKLFEGNYGKRSHLKMVPMLLVKR